jgi:hypothetical protein
MMLAADLTIWRIWDNAPVEWYLIYITCAFLGFVVLYVFWRMWGSHHDSDDDKD